MTAYTTETGGGFRIYSEGDVERAVLEPGVGATISAPDESYITDGVANHYKIVAEGTLEVTVTAPNSGTTSVTLTALGTLPTTPAFHGHIAGGSAETDPKHPSTWVNAEAASGFVADTSGGAVTTRSQRITAVARLTTKLTAGQAVVELVLDMWGTTGSETVYAGYAIFEEAAI